MFSPTNLDEVYVKATHLEARGKMYKKKVRRIHSKVVKKERTLKESKSKILLSRKKGRNLCARIVPKRAMMKRIAGSFI